VFIFLSSPGCWGSVFIFLSARMLGVYLFVFARMLGVYLFIFARMLGKCVYQWCCSERHFYRFCQDVALCVNLDFFLSGCYFRNHLRLFYFLSVRNFRCYCKLIKCDFFLVLIIFLYHIFDVNLNLFLLMVYFLLKIFFQNEFIFVVKCCIFFFFNILIFKFYCDIVIFYFQKSFDIFCFKDLLLTVNIYTIFKYFFMWTFQRVFGKNTYICIYIVVHDNVYTISEPCTPIFF